MWPQPGIPFYDRRLRTEHWANAKFQGAAAGSLMLGANAPYDRIPYFYSDQYDLGMEYTGRAEPGDRLVVSEASLADREFVAFWTRRRTSRRGMNANIWDVAKPIERLIRSRAVVDPAVLADRLRRHPRGSTDRPRAFARTGLSAP